MTFRVLRGLAAGAVVLAVVALLATRGDSHASDTLYRLDETFGEGGVAVADFAPGNRAFALALQADGEIVVTGEDSQNNLVVARFLANGTLDTDFATDGLFTSELVRRGQDIIVLPNGNIVATGQNDEHLVRLLEDGTPDATFDGDGVTGSQFFNPNDLDETEQPEMVRLIPWSNGRTIVAGSVDYGPYFFTFARYLETGEIDEPFGDDGQVQTNFSAPNSDQEPLALIPYDATHFVAAGYVEPDDLNLSSSVIAMYDTNGELEDSFGDNGRTTNDFFALNEEIRELLPQPEGRILAIGNGQIDIGSNAIKDAIFLARYDADGTLNDDYGDNGFIIFDDLAGSWDVEGAGLLPDGSVIIAGLHGNQSFFAKFDEEGNPDTTFGIGGFMLLEVAAPAGGVPDNSQIRDMAIDGDGNIFAAGSVSTPGGSQMAVFKLTNSPLPPVGDEHIWGDMDCDGEISTRDNQALLRNVLTQAALSQTQPCPNIGAVVNVFIGDVGLPGKHWGNLDCDEDGITTRDNQALLRDVLSQAALSQTEPCPDIGDEVLVAVPG